MWDLPGLTSPALAGIFLTSGPPGNPKLWYFRMLLLHMSSFPKPNLCTYPSCSLLMYMCMLSPFSHIQLFVTRWTVTCQALLFMGFFWQEYWSGLPCPPPGDLPNPRIKPMSLIPPALAGRFFITSAIWEAPPTHKPKNTCFCLYCPSINNSVMSSLLSEILCKPQWSMEFLLPLFFLFVSTENIILLQTSGHLFSSPGVGKQRPADQIKVKSVCFINKVLLEHSHAIHLHVVYGCSC